MGLNRLFMGKFQSTLPYGSDLGVTVTTEEESIISIHAPLRERPSCHLIALL